VQLVFLAFADLNQALLGKNLDAIMQSSRNRRRRSTRATASKS
jgi:hypothetical protein